MWKDVIVEKTLVLMNKKSRSIAKRILHDRISLPEMTQSQNDAWSEYVAQCGFTEPGGVSYLGENTPLVTGTLQDAISTWLLSKGLTHRSIQSKSLPLACTGAQFHHDADSFPEKVFCILWLSDDTSWDLFFPHANERIALEYGTVVLFDSAMPHGVVPRGESIFDWDTFEYATGVFISQDLTVNKEVRKLMGIDIFSKKGKRDCSMLNHEGYRESLDECTATWHLRKLK